MCTVYRVLCTVYSLILDFLPAGPVSPAAFGMQALQTCSLKFACTCAFRLLQAPNSVCVAYMKRDLPLLPSGVTFNLEILLRSAMFRESNHDLTVAAFRLPD